MNRAGSVALGADRAKVILAVAAVSLTAAAFIASIVPATRAASIAPMQALRTE